MDFIIAFFGRFHPLLVHLPIGILFLAFLFECLSLIERYKTLRKAIQPALLCGAIVAVAAAITGYFLRQEGGYDETIANRHQNFGILTAVLALVVYVIRPKVKYWVNPGRRRKQVKLVLSIPLIISLIITGHWGGSLTHGEDYLFAGVSVSDGRIKDPAEKIRSIPDVEQAVLYNDVIQPIFEARCYDCHSASKQKGDLRLDRQDLIVRGGENGSVIGDGPADSSALIRRLMLPLEHEDHMPPNEKPQLSSSEIALIRYWIEDNASFEKSVAQFESDAKIAAIIRTMQLPPKKSWVPTEEVDAADRKAVDVLIGLGINPMPLAEASNYLMVTFAGKRQITDDQINALQQIQKQLVWLNLSDTGITDQQLAAIAALTNLRVLYLNGTQVTDEGLSKLSSLSELRSLSLVGTQISDKSAPTLLQLKNLTALYLYKTGMTENGIRTLTESSKELNIDTGNYMLEKLPTDTIIFKKISLAPN